MHANYMLEWTLGTLLTILVAFMAFITAMDHRLRTVPMVDRPYLGEWCIAPAGADLEACYGLDPGNLDPGKE